MGRVEIAGRLDCSSILRTTSRLRKLYTRSRTQTRCLLFTRARRPAGWPTGAGSSRRRSEGGWHARTKVGVGFPIEEGVVTPPQRPPLASRGGSGSAAAAASRSATPPWF